jgi:hypothetical protein
MNMVTQSGMVIESFRSEKLLVVIFSLRRFENDVTFIRDIPQFVVDRHE